MLETLIVRLHETGYGFRLSCTLSLNIPFDVHSCLFCSEMYVCNCIILLVFYPSIKHILICLMDGAKKELDLNSY